MYYVSPNFIRSITMIQIINQPSMIYSLCHWLLGTKYSELACSITSFPHFFFFLLSLLNLDSHRYLQQ